MSLQLLSRCNICGGLRVLRHGTCQDCWLWASEVLMGALAKRDERERQDARRECYENAGWDEL